jgi:hypothetical protein
MLSPAEQQPSPRLASAARGEPVEIASAGAPLQATYYGARDPAPPGPRLAVLILERASTHDVPGRLARALAAAGYAALVVDVRPGAGRPDSDVDARISDARAALTALRGRAAPERTVLVGDVSLAAVVAHCGAAEHADGLVLVGSRLPTEAQPSDLDVFDALEPFTGAALLLGAGDTETQGSAAGMLAAHAESWRLGAAGRHLELGVVDGPRATLPVGTDHHLEPGAYAGVVVELTVQWLERRFGPGYPRAWQGPPPARDVPPPARPEGIEVQVPLLATGATLVPVPEGTPGATSGAWRLELPDGRAFALTDALRRLVSLVDGHRPVGAIAAELSATMGRPIGAEQVGHLLRERLAPLGVLEPDARGEGGEDESGMTDILIRCYEPHDRLRALLDNLTKVTRSPYNILLIVGKRSAVLNQNVGLDRARTRYAVFLDDDVILTEGWLERLRETMDRTGAGAVSARQLRMDGSPLSTAAACGEGNIVEALSGGACFMFRTDVGLRFDETYVRSQWDDVDFMFHLFERGYNAYVDGRVDFYHHNDPKVWRAQNLCHFVDKWTGKGLLRGWALYTYENGSAFMPCFGPTDEAAPESEG